ncbi:MAG: endolytic transglycosylase MltG [Paracoccaceae bacterium]
MRNVAANALTILIVLGLLVLGALGVAQQRVTSPGPLTKEVTVQVPRGASVRQISGLLAESGVLPDNTLGGLLSGEQLFRLTANYSGKAQSLKFGEYAIAPGTSVQEIVDLLAEGGNVQHTVTVPEGMSVAQAVERVNAAELLTGEIAEMPTEGSLFPETWAYERGATRQSVIDRMQTRMNAVLEEAWAARAPDLPLKNKEELLVLASIIEKETRPAEHAKVASVFINRLRLGMKLQTDPTVIYGITLGQAPLGRGLRRSELSARTPYNTYVIEGLPPTPIANPGRESLMAAAQPDQTDYLYFVADGTGGHAFATNLDDHNRNVANWRRIERERNANQ